MTTDLASSGELPRATMATLMLAVFVVSIGYGVVLPALPYLIERLLGAASDAALVSRHTGLLTALYALSLFLFAPLWGRWSDRRGPRSALLFGLLGFGATTLAFSFADSLAAIYAGRLLSGVFAAAVTPVAAAVVASFTATEHGRARRLTFIGMASIAGFFLGPMLGVYATRVANTFVAPATAPETVTMPLAATALLALLVACAVAIAIPRGEMHHSSPMTVDATTANTAWLLPKLLILTFIVSATVGVFEVGLALRGRQQLGLTPYQIAWMFAECSVVMFASQALVFAPWFQPAMTRWLIAPALSLLAIALFLMPRASDFVWMVVVVGVVAATAGILSPILTYWISAKAAHGQGWELGRQSAAASLGVTIGSMAGGLLFNVPGLPGASFFLAALMAMLGFFLSLKVPHLLVPRNLEVAARVNDLP